MNRICWWLVLRISQVLERDLQDAVRGDLAELNLNGEQALLELLGLIARRQMVLWKDWRPWLALFAIAGVVAVRLIHIALTLGGFIALQLSFWLKYGTHFGIGLTVTEEVVFFLSYSLAVASWSWTAGFAFGSLSRRTIWLSGSLFFLVWLLVVPLRFLISSKASDLLLVLLPAFLAHAILFLLPFFRGLHSGFRLGSLGLRPTAMWTAALLLISMIAFWTNGWQQNALETMSQGACCGTANWTSRLFPLALASSPVTYLVATASQRWRERMVPG